MPKDRGPQRGPSSQHWMTFVRNHAKGILACDFFVTVTASFRVRVRGGEVVGRTAQELRRTYQPQPVRMLHYSADYRIENAIVYANFDVVAYFVLSFAGIQLLLLVIHLLRLHFLPVDLRLGVHRHSLIVRPKGSPDGTDFRSALLQHPRHLVTAHFC